MKRGPSGLSNRQLRAFARALGVAIREHVAGKLDPLRESVKTIEESAAARIERLEASVEQLEHEAEHNKGTLRLPARRLNA